MHFKLNLNLYFSSHQTKLYYTPTSCGAASFIAAYVANVSLESEQVDLREHKTASGADFYKINPKGNVPCLILDDGTILNENAAVLQYIADQAPGTVAPESGANGRYMVQNVLNYISSEVHASIGGLFNPTITPEVRAFVLAGYLKKISYVNDVILSGSDFVVGKSSTIADFYLYITLTWTGFLGIDISPYPNVCAFLERVKSLPKIIEAHALMATSPTHTAWLVSPHPYVFANFEDVDNFPKVVDFHALMGIDPTHIIWVIPYHPWDMTVASAFQYPWWDFFY